MAEVSTDPRRRQGQDYRGKGPCPSKTQPIEEARCKERRPSDSSTPQEVKNEQQNQQQRPNKPSGHDKCMNNRQDIDSHGSGACTRLRHHLHVPSQYKRCGPWVRGKRGYGLAVGGKGEVYSGVPVQALLGEMSCQDGILPKRGKDKLELLVACHRSQKERTPNPYSDGNATKNKKTKKTLLCGMEHGMASIGKW